MRPALRATLGAMALILLIGCANVAALVLGQVDARYTEIAVRLALGASRWRLTQQLVIEVLIIAATAGALGAGAPVEDGSQARGHIVLRFVDLLVSCEGVTRWLRNAIARAFGSRILDQRRCIEARGCFGR